MAKPKPIFSDPTFIPNKDNYFMAVAKQVATRFLITPIAAGGCIIVRDRDIIGSGRSVLAECKVEIDCMTYAIATACKRGTPTAGAIVYTTRYPFSCICLSVAHYGYQKNCSVSTRLGTVLQRRI